MSRRISEELEKRIAEAFEKADKYLIQVATELNSSQRNLTSRLFFSFRRTVLPKLEEIFGVKVNEYFRFSVHYLDDGQARIDVGFKNEEALRKLRARLEAVYQANE